MISRSRPRSLGVQALALSLVLASACCHVSAREALSVSIVPQWPPDQILSAWRPAFDQITRETGERFKFKHFDSIPEFESSFMRGEVDVAYMNPYHAVIANEAQGYTPIVRDDARKLQGILVVREDSPIQDVRELNGANIAFPAPNAFGASLYMRALLANEMGIEIKPMYVSTHSNVYRHVLPRLCRAGGGVQRTLDRETAGIRGYLRILYRTPKVFPHPITTHPRIPDATRESLRAALLKLADTPRTQALLAAIQMPSPVAASLDDYQSLKTLGLERFLAISD